MTASHLETTLLYLIRANLLPEPLIEYKFCEYRKWRADIYYPPFTRPSQPRAIIIEAEGGTRNPNMKSRHTSPKGFRDDCIKYNWASMNDIIVLRFPADMIEDGTAIQTIKEALG